MDRKKCFMLCETISLKFITWMKIKIITWLKRITFIIQQNQINFIQINYDIHQNKIQYTGRRILKDDDVGIQREKKNLEK